MRSPSPRPPRPPVVFELLEALPPYHEARQRLLKPIAQQCRTYADFLVMPVANVTTDLMRRVNELRDEKARRLERYGYLPDD